MDVHLSPGSKPLQYDPGVEQPAANERDTDAAIMRSMRGILQTTWADYGHSVRSVHAKSHGLLEGELQVLEGLPDALAQGVFARAGSYPVVLRFSTNPGDILDDTVSSPRGLAIKIIGVEGDRLPGSEQDTTQDFVMVNGPAFVAPNAASFAKSLKLLAATTDTGQGWKKLFSAALRGVVALSQSLGIDGSSLKALGGQPMTHPLGETFYTQTPFRHGDYIAKLSVAPVEPALIALHDVPVPLAGKPNGLRAAVIDYFRAHGGTWELRVQLRTNAGTMPIEDASVPWPEQESPYVPVARITVPPQPAWSEERARQADDGLAFSPWHGLAAHQPLGSINRARKAAYAMSAGYRTVHNGCPIHEPRERLVLSESAPGVYGRTIGREGRRPNTPDARPGAWTQPMVLPLRKVTAGAIGGLAAGLLISGVMLGMEAASREPSELVRLKRRTGRQIEGRKVWGHKVWAARDEAVMPNRSEQVVSHGGHLMLSVAAGAVYGVAKPDNTSPLVAGVGLGLGFWGLAYGVLGPAARVTPPLWKDEPASLVQHSVLHVVFGVATALIADRVQRRL